MAAPSLWAESRQEPVPSTLPGPAPPARAAGELGAAGTVPGSAALARRPAAASGSHEAAAGGSPPRRAPIGTAFAARQPSAAEPRQRGDAGGGRQLTPVAAQSERQREARGAADSWRPRQGAEPSGWPHGKARTRVCEGRSSRARACTEPPRQAARHERHGHRHPPAVEPGSTRAPAGLFPCLPIRPRGDGRDRRGPCCPRPHPPRAGYRCRWVPAAPHTAGCTARDAGPPVGAHQGRCPRHGTGALGRAAQPGGCSTSAHGSSTSPTPLAVGTSPQWQLPPVLGRRGHNPPGHCSLSRVPTPGLGVPSAEPTWIRAGGPVSPRLQPPERTPSSTQPRAAPGTPSPILGREQGAGEGLGRGEGGRLKPGTESIRKRA